MNFSKCPHLTALRPYLTVIGMALGLVAAWASLVQL
jgi:hypothetical protein